jgi:hypothetical protein
MVVVVLILGIVRTRAAERGASMVIGSTILHL